MPKPLKLSGNALDNEIRRINKQIKGVYEKFGAGSRQYQEYDRILSSKDMGRFFNFGGVGSQIRIAKGGYVQIARTKNSLNQFETDENAQRGLKWLSEQRTVAELKEAYLESAKKRAGIGEDTKLTRKEKEALIKGEMELDNAVRAEFEELIDKIYKAEEITGIESGFMEEIREMFRGSRIHSVEKYQQAINRIKAEMNKVKQGTFDGHMLDEDEEVEVAKVFSDYD